jgi:hypothetical protein
MWCDVADCLDPAAWPRESPNAFHARDVGRGVAARTPREKASPAWVSFRPERLSGTFDSVRCRGDDEDRFRGWPAGRVPRTHVLASHRPGAAGQRRAVGRHGIFPLYTWS